MSDVNCRPMVIPLSFVIAFMLTLMPLPDWAIPFRPAWLALVLIYWVMALPQRVGLGTAWILGLLLDVSQGALLGQHALGLTVIAFITLKFYQRIRVFPLWQQGISIMLILVVYSILIYWIYGVTGHPPGTWMYWMPVITSGLLWPWIFVLLRDVRRRCKLS